MFPTITRPVITQVATEQRRHHHQQEQQQQQPQRNMHQSHQQKMGCAIDDALVSSVGLMVCPSNVQTHQRGLASDNNQDSNDSNETLTLTNCPAGQGTSNQTLSKKSGLRNDVTLANCAMEQQTNSQNATLTTGSSTSSSSTASANSSSVSSPQHDSYESVVAAATTSAGGQSLQQQQQQQLHDHDHDHHQHQHHQQSQEHHHLMSSDVDHSQQHLSSHIITTNSNCGSTNTTGVRNALISDTVNLSPTPQYCKYFVSTSIVILTFKCLNNHLTIECKILRHKKKIRNHACRELFLWFALPFAACDYFIKRTPIKWYKALSFRHRSIMHHPFFCVSRFTKQSYTISASQSEFLLSVLQFQIIINRN